MKRRKDMCLMGWGGDGSTRCRYSRGKVWLGDVSLHTRSVVVGALFWLVVWMLGNSFQPCAVRTPPPQPHE